MHTVIGDLLSHLSRLDERIAEYDGHVQRAARENERARQLMRLAGVGPTTRIGAGRHRGQRSDFKSSRQFSAWLGLVPGQHSSGGKARLGSITKAGRRVPRTLLILGARSMLMKAAAHTDPVSRWAIKLKERRGGRAVVAIAAKNARMCWAALRLVRTSRVPA